MSIETEGLPLHFDRSDLHRYFVDMDQEAASVITLFGGGVSLVRQLRNGCWAVFRSWKGAYRRVRVLETLEQALALNDALGREWGAW